MALREALAARSRPRIPRIPRPSLTWREPPQLSYEKAKEHMRRALSILFPRPERIWSERKLEKWDNAVVKRHVTIYGAQMTGKSHTARWIASEALKAYQGHTVRCIMHRDDLSLLLGNIPVDAEVAILYGEDLTSALEALTKRKIAEVARDWFRIRHKFREATGRNRGLVIALLGMHRFHGAPPAFTTDNDLLIFKSLPTNPYDRSVVKSFIGDEGIEFLADVERERVNDPHFIGYGVWWHRGEVGVWYNPRYDGPDPFTLLIVEREEEETQADSQPEQAQQYEFLRMEKDEAFLEEVLERLKKRVKPRDLEIFTAYIYGDSSREISRRYNITDRRVRQIIYAIREEHLGYAAEEAYHRRHPHLERGGENTPLPDFIDHEAKRVISFKCYVNPELGPGSGLYLSKRIGRKEWEYAQQHGYELRLLVYECTPVSYTHLTLPTKA